MQEKSYSPLALLSLYFADGRAQAHQENRLWQKMDALLSWQHVIGKKYQYDLCPLLFVIAQLVQNGTAGRQSEWKAGKGIIPAALMALLEREYHLSLARNLVLLHETKELMKNLAKESIRPIVLKGASLSETIYDDISCRPMGDIDLLIPEKDQERGGDLLVRQGYATLPIGGDETMHRCFYKQVMGQLIAIELHHRLAKEVFGIRFDPHLLGPENRLPVEYELVYLAWHGIRHGLSRIIWICDLAGIMRKYRSIIDWKDAERRSILANTGNHFKLCLHLAGKLFGSEINTRSVQPLALICELLFLKIQKKVLHGMNIRPLANVLTMLLMPPMHVIKLLPHRLAYSTARQA